MKHSESNFASPLNGFSSLSAGVSKVYTHPEFNGETALTSSLECMLLKFSVLESMRRHETVFVQYNGSRMRRLRFFFLLLRDDDGRPESDFGDRTREIKIHSNFHHQH